jgi:similar to siphovirus gp157|uniref:Resistance protein n=1 Tax=Siphoviridae sp. ctpoI7 TaxID=2825678 RepID=A0A8S5PBD2_9CAUD|nr:MAG TPA: resistance protein [Siphoviridae sp. ctpoI7]
MNLYELSQNYLAVQDMDLEPETLKDTLDSIEEAIEVKAENIAKWIRNLEADKKAFEEEEKRFKEKKQAADNRIKSLKLYLEDNMRLTGKTKFKAGFFSFAIQNNPPSVEVFDEALIPKQFLIEQPVKIDRAGIKELLKAGEEVPGAELKHSTGLRIR